MTHPLTGRLGGRRDRPDARDRRHQPATVAALPAAIDLRDGCPPVYDQGQINSCTAQAIAAAIAYSRRKHGQWPDFTPSRLFVYYNERALHGQTAEDCGASTRDGIKTVAAQGVPDEALWPYDALPANPPGGAFPPDSRAAQQPPSEVYAAAAPHLVTAYYRIDNELEAMKRCLAEGYPHTIGLVVYPSFVGPDHRQPAVVPMPGLDEQPLGEHVVLAVGYDDAQQWLICRNSWGPSQGDGGYFYLPYAYASSKPRIGDLWSLRTVEE